MRKKVVKKKTNDYLCKQLAILSASLALISPISLIYEKNQPLIVCIFVDSHVGMCPKTDDGETAF